MISAVSLPYRASSAMASTKRRMTLPSIANREDPIYRAAERPPSDPGHQAAFIFVHGLGDSGQGLESIVEQFQAAHKLPHMHWILPNAMNNRDAMTTAWYTPTSLSPFPTDRPELEDEEDELGMLASVAYIETLIDACRNKGIPENRIVLGGFSQGCAISLLTDLISKKYSGRLAGIVALMGYLPLASKRRLEDLRAKAGLPQQAGEVPTFLARGQKDQLIPKRVWNASLKKLSEFEGTALESHEYEGLGHSLNASVLTDICKFLERIVPSLED